VLSRVELNLPDLDVVQQFNACSGEIRKRNLLIVMVGRTIIKRVEEEVHQLTTEE